MPHQLFQFQRSLKSSSLFTGPSGPGEILSRLLLFTKKITTRSLNCFGVLGFWGGPAQSLINLKILKMASTTKVTVDEFSKLIQNRRDLYEAVLRNDWYLPKFKTSMVTESYLRNVLTGKTFCPKYSEIKLRPCPRPPNKDLLLKKFLKIA